MNNTDVYIDEPIERESKGYQLHGEEILTCSNCKKQLVSIIVVKTNCPIFVDGKEEVDVVRFVANCPLCNSFSFVKKFERVKLYYKAIEPLRMVDAKFVGRGKEQRCEIELK